MLYLGFVLVHGSYYDLQEHPFPALDYRSGSVTTCSKHSSFIRLGLFV